ncbi:hypothetical protein AYI70_g5320, partial [Smittium culicis]
MSYCYKVRDNFENFPKIPFKNNSNSQKRFEKRKRVDVIEILSDDEIELIKPQPISQIKSTESSLKDSFKYLSSNRTPRLENYNFTNVDISTPNPEKKSVHIENPIKLSVEGPPLLNRNNRSKDKIQVENTRIGDLSFYTTWIFNGEKEST